MDLALRSLDDRLAADVARVRRRGVLSLDELRGLYVSAEHVEQVLTPRAQAADRVDDDDEASLSEPLLLHPVWRGLAQSLAPTAIERDLVLLALARDVRLEYERVFGFLNDDLTKRWPTRDLAMRILARGDADRVVLRDALADRAPLIDQGVLRIIDGEHGSWLGAGVGATPLAAALLTGVATPENDLPRGVAMIGTSAERSVPEAASRRLAQIVDRALDRDDGMPVVVLEGAAGSGRTRLAADLAERLECALLHVDAKSSESAIVAALLWQRIAGAVILVDGDASPVSRRLVDAAGPVLIRAELDAPWHAMLAGHRAAHVSVASESVAERGQEWMRATERHTSIAIDATSAAELADRFALTSGAIARVVRRAADEGRIASLEITDVVAQLSATARDDCRDALGAVAARVPTPYTWDDLILPAPTMARLRDFASAVRDRSTVLDRWAFGRRATRARGVTALFAGPSGTGKTMAASVVARELSLDLFVIDLSSLVSKYIGETEKNLDRVFRAARGAGAILFFDEADALFGKRSEVKDAHDRYANIEVAYLLQQLDAHDGVVVLATNLSRNLDAAFSRRMRYVVDFPLPGEADRLRLWRGIFPAEAPLEADVDLEFVATRFALAGGDIRNVALEAAYLAAADGVRDRSATPTIGMRHVVRATARQLIKQGKTPSAADFRQYIALVDRES
jgi:AAA+ superfamily predicted ATPase